MIFEVPIRYKASGRKKGNTLNSTLPFQEKIAVDVRVTTDEEAPIVAEWDDTPPTGTSNGAVWVAHPGAEREHVRSVGNAFWRPLRSSEVKDDGCGDPISVGDFIRASEEGGHKGGFPPAEMTGRKYFGAADYFETVDFTDRNWQVKAVAAAAVDLLVVDGTLYQRCIEPMIVLRSALFQVETNGRPLGYMGEVMRIVNRPRTDTSQAGRQSYEGFERADTFPLHMFREALIRSRRKNATNQRVKDMLNEMNAAKQPILSGDYFLDPANAAASDCAIKLRQFLAVIEKDRDTILPVSDTQKMRIVCDLSDALDAMPSGEAMDIVEAAGQEYLDRYEVDRAFNHPEQVFLKQAIKAAAERPIWLPGGSHQTLTVSGR